MTYWNWIFIYFKYNTEIYEYNIYKNVPVNQTLHSDEARLSD